MNDFFDSLRIAFKEKNQYSLKAGVVSLLNNIINGNAPRITMNFHPLGFIYARLHDFPNNEAIRLHLWDKVRKYQEPLMEIHNHFYTVNSYVVTGKIKNIIYKLVETSASNYLVYEARYTQAGERILTSTGRSVFAQVQREEIIHKDQQYNIIPSDLHSSFVDLGDFTSTLVFTENPGQPTPMVLGPVNGKAEYNYQTIIVESSATIDIINKILRHIS